MANVVYVGNAKTVAQVDTITVGGTVAIGDTVTVTINGKAVVATATAGTVANMVTVLKAALEASTFPEFLEITWATDSTTHVTGTSVVAGRPFTIASVTPSASVTASNSTTTTSSGPNDLGLAANYSGGALPSASDVLQFPPNAPNVLYNLEALVAISLARVDHFAGPAIGLPRINTTGQVAYAEYRPLYLKLKNDVPIININMGGTAASTPASLVKVWSLATSTASVMTVFTGSPQSGEGQGFGSVIIKVAHTSSSSATIVLGGTVSIAPYTDETSATYTLRVNQGATVLGGRNFTLNASGATALAGTVTLWDPATIITVVGPQANVTLRGLAGAGCGVVFKAGGTVNWACSNYPAMDVKVYAPNATITFSGDVAARSRSATTFFVYESGFAVNDQQGTINNPIMQLDFGIFNSSAFNFGPTRGLTWSG
jgi:hypothetical protein